MSKPTIRELLDGWAKADLDHCEPFADQMAERVEAVLRLHRHRPNQMYPDLAGHCVVCCDEQGHTASWPCPTIRALEGEESR